MHTAIPVTPVALRPAASSTRSCNDLETPRSGVPPSAASALASTGPIDGWALCRVVLDQLDFGIVIVSPDADVVMINRAAEYECSVARSVTVEDGCLRARSKSATLAHAIEQGANGLRQMVAIDDGDEVLPLMVVPVADKDAPSGALVLVVLGRRHLADPVVTEMYARQRHLTGAEAAVLRGLGDGFSPKEYSNRGGVAISTVRTHLSAAREKLGAGSIDQVLYIMGCLPPAAPTLYRTN